MNALPAHNASEQTAPVAEHALQSNGNAQPALRRTDSFITESSQDMASASPIRPFPPFELATDTFIETPGWLPHYIKTLAPLPDSALASIPPPAHMKTFSFAFLTDYLGGIEWSPSFFYIPHSHGGSLLPNRSYYALDATHEPFLPAAPGAHGAKLTPFFNANPTDAEHNGEEIYDSFPVFVAASKVAPSAAAERFVYFGTYSQARWSDRLDYDAMVNQVPGHVKQYWAKQLAEVGRPEWVTGALRKHFFPAPEYAGSLGAEAAATGSESVGEEGDEVHERLERDVKEYVEELRAWKKDADFKTGLLSYDALLKAFERADADDPPGLRLQWEYLKCVGYDRDFYDWLVMRQAEKENTN